MQKLKSFLTKFFSLLLSLSLIFSLAACGGGGDSSEEGDKPASGDEVTPGGEDNGEQGDPGDESGTHFEDVSGEKSEDAQGKTMYTVKLSDILSECSVRIFENDWYIIDFNGFCRSLELDSHSSMSEAELAMMPESLRPTPKIHEFGLGEALKFTVTNKMENATYDLSIDTDLRIDGIPVYDSLLLSSDTYMMEVDAEKDVNMVGVAAYRSPISIYDYYSPEVKMFDLTIYTDVENIEKAPDEAIKALSEDKNAAKGKVHVRVLVDTDEPNYYMYQTDDTAKIVYEDDSHKIFLIGHQTYELENGKKGYIMRFWYQGDPDTDPDEAVVIPEFRIDGKRYEWDGANIGDYMYGNGFMDLIVYAADDFSVTKDSVISLNVNLLSPYTETVYEFKANPEIIEAASTDYKPFMEALPTIASPID